MEKYIFIYYMGTTREDLTILPTSKIQELYVGRTGIWIYTEKKEYRLSKLRESGADDENDEYSNICNLFFQFLNTEERTFIIKCDEFKSRKL